MFWHVVNNSLEEEHLVNAEQCLHHLEECDGSSEDFALIKELIQHL